MKSATTLGFVMPALRAAGAAAALACSAGAAMAADASVSITSFTATAEAFSGNFVFALDPYQSYDMTALNGGGLFGASSDTFSADDWNQGLNRVAQTSNAHATGNTLLFTDAATQLTTAGFNLGATALPGPVYPDGTPPNQANAIAILSGTFQLVDSNGQAVAGSITFDLYYDMGVSPPFGGLFGSFSQTALSLLAATDSGANASFDDGLLSSSLPGGVGSTSGHFSWTFALDAGESAYYTLSSSAIAAAMVPEPGSVALFGVGMFAVASLVRRRRAAAQAV